MQLPIDDYLDVDVAYLVGLIVARGTFREQGNERSLILDFPYGNMQMDAVRTHFDQQVHLRLAIGEIKNRLYELLQTDIQDEYSVSFVRLTVRFTRNTMAWRNLRLLTEGKTNFWEFGIPAQIESASLDIRREFLRGIADACGYIRQSNNYMGQWRRVYLEIANRNWRLPIQICRMLQVDLSVSVQTIQWGHPNTREPFNPDSGQAWAREHQVKVFAEEFEKLGFNIAYKQQALSEFAQDDRERFGNYPQMCNPRVKQVRRRKPPHPEEASPLLPEELRDKHFDAYWQICRRMGCRQGIRPDGTIYLIENEEDDLGV